MICPSLSQEQHDSYLAYFAFLCLREYCLARGLEQDATALEEAYGRSNEAVNVWINLHPETHDYLQRAVSPFLSNEALNDSVVGPDGCSILWPSVACYFYGVAEPSGDILKATEDGWIGWRDTLLCPDRLKKDKGPAKRGAPAWLRWSIAAGVVGASLWMVRSLTRK